MSKGSDKSYVTMEQHLCPVCGETFDTGALLMDKGLREKFEKETVTGYGLCPEHNKVVEDGYIILLAVDASSNEDRIKVGEAQRTGEMLYVRRELAESIFTSELESLMFCDAEVVTTLKNMHRSMSG